MPLAGSPGGGSSVMMAACLQRQKALESTWFAFS